MSTVYYSVKINLDLIDEVYVSNGLKTISLYCIEKEKLKLLETLEAKIEDKSIDLIFDYFGVFHKILEFQEL